MSHPNHSPTQARAGESTRASPFKHSSRDEVRGAYRAQSIQAIEEVDGDVAAFLEEVDTKRRQLDEQIHRYVKQREREFKLFERDARIKYRSAGAARPPSPRTSSMSSSSSLASMVGESGKTSPGMHSPDVNSVAKPRNPRERETEFLGVFTPSFLPLLNNGKKNTEPQAPAANVAPSTSAPAAVSPISTLARSGEKELHRTNSDPSDEPKNKQVRIKLEKRHSSSGSEGRGLVSALKSGAGQPREPKRKRVSLIVGDEVVAPSDNISAYESANELARELAHPNSSEMSDGDESGDDTSPVPVADGSQSPERNLDGGIPSGHPVERHKSGISFGLANSQRDDDEPKSPIRVEHVPVKSAGEDVFGFDDIITEDESDPQNDNIPDDLEVSPIPSPAPATDIPQPSFNFTIPERPVSQIRTLSSSSNQPISPGFSRPSVTSDPMLMYNRDLVSPEIEDNMDYGSVTHSFLDRTGSLGESFMERNAQELKRLGRQRTSTAKAG